MSNFTSTLPVRWSQWVVENLLKGVPAQSLYHTLLGHGFAHATIVRVLGGNLPQPLAVELEQQFLQRIAVPRFCASSSKDIEQIDNSKMQLFQLKDFFTVKQCEALVALTKSSLRPSGISTSTLLESQSFRTSSTCDLSLLNDDIANAAEQQIIQFFGLGVGENEPVQAQCYATGQQFKAHTDYFEPGTTEYQKFATELGQRTWTCMIYLNDGCEGGETEFVDIGVIFKPKRGTAIFWNNLNSDGTVNPHTKHQAHPVTAGEKVIITKWFRTGP